MGHFRPPEVVSVILLNKTLFTGSLWAHFEVICSVLVYMFYFVHENITYLNITQIIKSEIIKYDAICYNLLCQKKSNSYKVSILMVRVHVKCLCFGSSLSSSMCSVILFYRKFLEIRRHSPCETAGRALWLCGTGLCPIRGYRALWLCKTIKQVTAECMSVHFHIRVRVNTCPVVLPQSQVSFSRAFSTQRLRVAVDGRTTADLKGLAWPALMTVY